MNKFSRWGELVFETSNQSEFWDSTFKDKAAISGVYVY
ncbi:MAG: gliding motility-associated C-terminal domain-containing protein [Bacteroidetes bacterium]|nr:gliding motility-associated C-terminal domain-containing protein [Bacteroidota bacterium]MDF1866639.1 gliding motility-associated C-terminal domain-containing protein [Saprospiraceae bacterium]